MEFKTAEFRPAIIRMHEKGKSMNQIAKDLGISRHAVQDAIKRFEETPSFLASFRVEFALVVGFRLIIALARWIFFLLLAVFSLFRFSLLPVSSNLLIVRVLSTVQYQETAQFHVLLFHFHVL